MMATDSTYEWLRERTADPDLLDWATQVLVRLCEIDTSLGADLDRMRQAEAESFQLIQSLLAPYAEERGTTRRLPVAADRIVDDPYFTTPYYANALADRPEEVYRDRYNQNVQVLGDTTGRAWLLNAHVDTVPPHVPPEIETDGHVSGRGSVDDKGGIVLMLLVARLLDEAARQSTLPSVPSVSYLFSIDEEMGGNGSLAAARQLSFEDTTVVVLEPTRLRPHPANRGALWFKVTLRAKSRAARRRALLAGIAQVVRSLARLGRRLQSESDHSLFHPADVQTCFGMLGSYGAHPSSACGAIDVEVRGLQREPLQEAVSEILDEAERDGRITRHAAPPEVRVGGEKGTFVVRLFAEEGHMGSRDRDSDAILKMAELVGGLEAREGVTCRLPDPPTPLVLEGGQGFVPTHTIEEVRAAMRTTFDDAIRTFKKRYGLGEDELDMEISFDKLQNDAYSSAPDAGGAPSIMTAVERLTDREIPELTGWQVSCDARIFARLCDDVVTFGPGALEKAHQPDEAIDVREIVNGAAVLVLAMLTDSHQEAEWRV
jgi:acetylornithine deacetylase/succinyl-diaminopimelate desuccinylase-like protein